MPQHKTTQSPIQYSAVMSGGGNPVDSTHGAKAHITLKLIDGVWNENRHDGIGWRVITTQTDYIPDMSVRGINPIKVVAGEHEAVATLEYDLIGYGPNWKESGMFQKGIFEPLATAIKHAIWATKIYLSGSQTDCTEIHLDG